MDEHKLFALCRDGEVLMVVLPDTAITFDDETIQDEAQAVIEQLNEPGVAHLILDFGHCPYFGSILIGQVIRFHNAVNAKKGQFVICNLSKEAHMLLETSHLLSLWTVVDSREEALALLNS